LSLSNDQNKFAILNFDDGWKSHYQIVKPILDKYNFKATFYIVCNYVQAGENVDEDKEDNSRMNWNEINELKNDGMDIGSHTMNHKDLEGLSNSEIEYEIGESKKCLIDQGINATTFAYPFSSGTDNEFVINVISKYYDVGRSGGSTLMFLHCDGWPNKSDQKNCRTFNENGELNPITRYSLLRWAHQNDRGNNDQELYENFVEFVNSQMKYNTPKDNSEGNSPLSVLAIPIIVYHNVANESEGKLTISFNLLEKEIKYLYDNHFKIKTMSDLKYNSTKDLLYIID
jgi:peptidoglycan/xylan/chitin deacetylase (PgdA/CDA1 family)